jgi:YD repeat-containing protein
LTKKVKGKNMSDTATYEYWPQGWLKKITFANGTTVTINYDAAGNRTSVVISCSGGGC